MTGQADLGHGVRVRRTADDEVVVTSEHLRLPLACPTGAAPGTAVEWDGGLWETVDRAGGFRVERWRLRPWGETVAVRRLVRLHGDSVARWSRERRDDAAAANRRRATLPLLPLLGFAPARIQDHWQSRWGFDAGRATLLSVLLELLVGAVGTVALVLGAFGEPQILPDWLWWLKPLGPLLAFEGVLRLSLHMPGGEAVGSVLGLPLELVVPRPVAAPPPAAQPAVAEIGDDLLMLRSPVCRGDWTPSGELRCRGRRWRLAAADREGVAWLYRFDAVPEDDPEPAELLSLPLRDRPREPVARAGLELGFAATVWLTVIACFASGPFQRDWARRFDLRPRTLTFLGAGFELLGGFVNLQRASASELSLLVVLNAFLVVEGLARVALAVIGGAPVGSLLGLPFEPAARRWLARRRPGPRPRA